MTDEAGKRELLDVLSKVPEEAARLEQLGREIQQTANFVREIALVERDAVSYIPAEQLPSEEIELRVQSWRTWQGSAGRLEVSVTPSKDLFLATSYTATTTSNTFIVTSSESWSVDIPEVEIAHQRMTQVLERGQLLERARSEMRRLGLEQAPAGGRPPLELLDEAYNSFGTGPTSALIPIREAINLAVDQMINRRLGPQEKAGGHRGKVMSLGKHCARSGVPMSQFEALGRDQETLVKELSGAKDRRLTYQQVSSLFHRALLHLDAILGSIDEARLRLN